MPRYDLCLVGCGLSKCKSLVPARYLYRSALFRQQFSLAMHLAPRTMIVSAKHELLHPDTRVAPYNFSIHDLSRKEQEVWAWRVGAQVGPGHGRSVALFMGGLYARLISQALTQRGWRVFEPLFGLQIGERLHWLSKAHAALSDEAAQPRVA